MFIILYPLGLIGELVDIYYTAGYVKGKNVLGQLLPSSLDFGVTYYHVIITLTCILVPRKSKLLKLFHFNSELYFMYFYSYSILVFTYAVTEKKNFGTG